MSIVGLSYTSTEMLVRDESRRVYEMALQQQKNEMRHARNAGLQNAYAHFYGMTAMSGLAVMNRRTPTNLGGPSRAIPKQQHNLARARHEWSHA